MWILLWMYGKEVSRLVGQARVVQAELDVAGVLEMIGRCDACVANQLCHVGVVYTVGPCRRRDIHKGSFEVIHHQQVCLLDKEL